MKNSRFIHISNSLNMIIAEMSSFLPLFSASPTSDFSRKRNLPFEKIIRIILGFQGKTLDKELIDIGKPPEFRSLI